MQAFGLVGTWSRDCEKDPMKGGYRITFAVPPFGAPTRSTIVSTPNGRFGVTTQADIKSAILVADDKIKLTLIYTSGAQLDGKILTKLRREPIEDVVEKIGTRIRVTVTNGNIEPFERCRNSRWRPYRFVEKPAAQAAWQNRI
jgi:hypothetical protein